MLKIIVNLIIFFLNRANGEYDNVNGRNELRKVEEKFENMQHRDLIPKIIRKSESLKTSTYCYFDIAIDVLNDNKISRRDFVISRVIRKIGQTSTSIRENTYNHSKGKQKRYRILNNCSKLDIIYGEHITTQNYNLKNLDGCVGGTEHLHIDPAVISFKDQNLLSNSWFENIFQQFINDREIFNENGSNKFKVK